MGLILLIVVIVLLVGALPTWGHSRKWGYGPTGGLGLVLVVIVILLLLGVIPRGFSYGHMGDGGHMGDVPRSTVP